MKIMLTAMSCTIIVLQFYTSGFGQEKRDHERPPSRGGDRSKWIEFARANANYLELMPLLAMDNVRNELSIPEENTKELSAFREDIDNQLSQLHRKHRERHADHDLIRGEEREAIRQANDKAKELLKKLISDEKQDRLLGLFAQYHGASTVRNELIATKIGIVDDKLTTLRNDIERKQHELMVESRKKFEEIFRSGADPAKFPKVFEDFKASLDDAIEELLSPEQKKLLSDLKGDKFDFGVKGPPGPPGRGGSPGRDRRPFPDAGPLEKGRESSTNEFIIKEKE